MGQLTVRALRVVLVVLLAGSVSVQALLVALSVTDQEVGELAGVLTPIRVLMILGILAVRVVIVCVWRLATMVRHGTVFSHAAFRYVDVMIGAIVAAALLVFVLAALLTPGEAFPPGGVLIVAGVGMAVLGVALIVLVLRMLLAQAVTRDAEAARLRSELDEVI